MDKCSAKNACNIKFRQACKPSNLGKKIPKVYLKHPVKLIIALWKWLQKKNTQLKTMTALTAHGTVEGTKPVVAAIAQKTGKTIDIMRKAVKKSKSLETITK